MSTSEDQMNNDICEMCAYAGNPQGWQICVRCGNEKNSKEFNKTLEYEVINNLDHERDNQETKNLSTNDNDTRYLEKISQLEQVLSSYRDSLSTLQDEYNNLEKQVVDLKAENNCKDEYNKAIQRQLDESIELRFKSREPEEQFFSTPIQESENLTLHPHKLLSYKLYDTKIIYSALTFTVLLFTFSIFIWFAYSELESQQISQHNMSLLVDNVSNKWFADLKSKTNRLKQSTSDKEKLITDLNKSNDLSKKQKEEIDRLNNLITEKDKQIEVEKQTSKSFCTLYSKAASNEKRIILCP